jgi:hypothetical protein
MGVSRTLVPCRSSLIEQGQLEVAGTGAAGYFNSRWRPQLGALSRPDTKQIRPLGVETGHCVNPNLMGIGGSQAYIKIVSAPSGTLLPVLRPQLAPALGPFLLTRGLAVALCRGIRESPPSRGRGSKHVNDEALINAGKVASFTGAWIETCRADSRKTRGCSRLRGVDLASCPAASPSWDLGAARRANGQNRAPTYDNWSKWMLHSSLSSNLGAVDATEKGQ